MSTILTRFGPPLALMGLIYFLSAQPDLNSGLGSWDLVLRKGAHMTEFGLLWLLWWRALGHGAITAAVGIALAYAAIDEYHQSFVSGRHGAALDWAIDAAGIALAIAMAVARARSSRARSR